MIRKANEEHEKGRLKRLIDNRCKRVVLVLFEKLMSEPEEISMHLSSKIMEWVSFNTFLNGVADVVLVNRTPKLAQSQDIRKSLVRHLIKSSIFTVLVARFVKKLAEIIVDSDKQFTTDLCRTVLVKKESAQPLPLAGHSPKTSNSSENDYQERTKHKTSSN